MEGELKEYINSDMSWKEFALYSIGLLLLIGIFLQLILLPSRMPTPVLNVDMTETNDLLRQINANTALEANTAKNLSTSMTQAQKEIVEITALLEGLNANSEELIDLIDANTDSVDTLSLRVSDIQANTDDIKSLIQNDMLDYLDEIEKNTNG